MLIAAAHELEKQVGVKVRAGQVADLVDEQYVGRGVAAQLAAQGRVAVWGGEVSQQLPGDDEQRRLTGEYGLAAQVAGAHLLAHAVGGVGEELQRHEFLDDRAIDLRGPAAVEVCDELELRDMRIAQAPLEASPDALLGLPAQPLRYARCGIGLKVLDAVKEVSDIDAAQAMASLKLSRALGALRRQPGRLALAARTAARDLGVDAR